ncbi:MAG: hypothetical protein FJ011_11925 [Chloroflexi bacterium]|nr:hypothetical protein [Chloroflexota bacterium]
MGVVSRVPNTIYERAILLDTGALEAIADPKDQYHRSAVRCRAELLELAYPLYITTLTTIASSFTAPATCFPA